ncbi:MAG: diguanylate cyclase [Proteobacteria bacterium]|nr:diguanylate cyclase [Pseudomonadota bacterium]MBU1612613.1 diguanylate cyclase [Pseudomonadota bacterium]
MPDVLLVEDSKFFASVVMRRFASVKGITVHWADSFAQAREKIENGSCKCFMALLDLNLPDSPRGEVVDWFVQQGIPSIVFTGGFDDKIRDTILSKNVVDYVLKENEDSLDTLVKSVQRIQKNKSIKVLVVDDSLTARGLVSKMLSIHQYQVLSAEGGGEALKMLDEHPDIKLVVTDYNMPDMDGFQLVKTIRKTHTKEDLAIIGMSAQGNNILSARFIKAGANDFINKPFLTEEFYCRVAQNVELIEYIELIRSMSYTDPLTGLANRRRFFEVAPEMFNDCVSKGEPLAIAMADIDHFKRVNDTFGHSAGDEVIKRVAEELKARFGADGLVCRFGGEEFCVLLPGKRASEAAGLFEIFRATMENAIVVYEHSKIKCTISVGVCTGPVESLDYMVTMSDDMLYDAKNSGRNQVVQTETAPYDS